MTKVRSRARVMGRTQEGGSPSSTASAAVRSDDRLRPEQSPARARSSASICGSQLSMRETDELPDCPRCGGSTFRRDSIFESPPGPRHDHRVRRPRHRRAAELARAGARAGVRLGPLPGLPAATTARSSPSRSSAAGPGSAAAPTPTCASTTPASPAATPSSSPKPANRCGCSTTAASTASSSTARRSSARPLSDGDELAIGRFSLFVARSAEPAFRPPPSLGLPQ